MDSQTFNAIVEKQIGRSTAVLIDKAAEYALDGDRLHNFNVAASLQGMTPRQALAGMMAKHTTSIYDMCRGDVVYSEDMINEKITDHINYLLLLRAIFEEEKQKRDHEVSLLKERLMAD